MVEHNEDETEKVSNAIDQLWAQFVQRLPDDTHPHVIEHLRWAMIDECKENGAGAIYVIVTRPSGIPGVQTVGVSIRPEWIGAMLVIADELRATFAKPATPARRLSVFIEDIPGRSALQ